MINLIQRHGEVKRLGPQDPELIILHDTVSPTVDSAIKGLQDRGLSYHYIIDVNGDVTELIDPHYVAQHAAGYNMDTIGISSVGGGPYGPVNDMQYDKFIELSKYLKEIFPELKNITGHRDVAQNGKIDPQWPGDTDQAVTLVHTKHMNMIAEATDLHYLNRKELYPHG